MSDLIKIPDVIRRRDAIDAFMDLPNCPNGCSDTYDKESIIGVLEDVPSMQDEIAKAVAAVIEQPLITRCRDCDDWDRDNVINNAAACAEWSDPENGMTRYTKECDFCSRAERREE